MKTFFTLVRPSWIIASVFGLGACHQAPTDTVALFTVHRQVIATPDIYNGTIKPLKTMNIVASSEGTIQRLNVHLGQQVNANDVLLVVNSLKFAKDYQQALLTYLKTKNDYANQVKKFQGTEELWKNGLIARNDYDSQQAEVANSYALLSQQQHDLKKYLNPLNAASSGEEQFNLQDKKQIDSLFNQQNNLLNIVAPMNGVVLAPLKTATTNGQDSINLPTQGSSVKEGDSLLCLGDLSGYIVTINISQMAINTIKVGQKATVSGDAFPEVLTGYVSQVSIQAKNDNSAGFNGMPTFPVEIQMTHLPKTTAIRLGMSAKVALESPENPVLSIPISAVGTFQGHSVVMRQRAQKRERVVITTGLTSLDQVQLLSGLAEGDVIVATYPT